MARPARSPVPDLLYEDQQEERVREIEAYLERPEDICAQGGALPLHRITVFLTYGCNLACPYCKTIARSENELQARPEKRVAYDLDAFAALLASHAGTPVRHLHFTGGEATMVRDLPAMIRLARARGVERLSVTSNGTLAPEVYLEIVRAGIDEIRVSLDAADPDLGRTLTLRRGAFHAAVRTLRALASARREGAPVHLIVNTVVGVQNRAALADVLAFILSFEPDDIKLITEVDARGSLADFPEASGVMRRIEAIVGALPEGSFPLLRRKIKTVFARDAIGLSGLPRGTDFRCYIPLTERTVDGVHYYPCSVFLREGGKPLGRIDEPEATQRAKTAAFVREGDCLRDPICDRYCLHCTRGYNIRANERRV
jgi:molybdenum cofactor biosynthesis enzyme MoaA